MNADAILKAKGREIATAKSVDRIVDAVKTMRQRNIGALVVSDDGETLAGIISERDILRGLADHGTGLLEKRVGDLMTRHVYTGKPDDEVAGLMSMMTMQRIRHVPVLNGGKLVGLISIGDVVKARLQEIEREAEQLRDYIFRS